MKIEDFKAKTEEIMHNLGDQGKVSTLLAELVTDQATEYSEKVKLGETNTTLTADIEKLRQANLELFLKVGTQPTPPDPHRTPDTDKPTYDTLFDENGKLK